MFRSKRLAGVRRGRLGQTGFTMIEVLIAAAILGVMTASLVAVLTFVSKQTVRTKDKVFATQKALQMMEELRAMVNANENQQIYILDQFYSGSLSSLSSYSPILTTSASVTNPANPLSGNSIRGTGWKFVRHIDVEVPENQPDNFVRQVTVRVFLANELNPSQGVIPLAQVSGILRTVGDNLVPSQAYDIYALTPLNVPGWWVNVSVLRNTFNDMISDIEARNPGFTPRVHYINRLSYGRDPEYAPFVNDDWFAELQPMPYVYFYPGRMHVDAGQDYRYFNAALLENDGAQMRAADNGTTQLYNPILADASHYSLADQFNHAERYPDEVRIYNAALAEAKAANPSDPTKWPEPTLRMILEDMNSNPNKYQNALIVNMGGEMLPIPPIRNYSDAAKWPDGVMNTFNNGLSIVSMPSTVMGSAGQTYIYTAATGWTGSLRDFRVVSHPEQLNYPEACATPVPTATATMTVKLRVYPYMMNYTNYSAYNRLSLPVASVFIPNETLAASSVSVRKIIGSADATDIASGYTNVAATTTASAGHPMDYQLTNVNGGTLIKLFNTNMRNNAVHQGCATAGQTHGLPTAMNIDPQLEYCPCPLNGSGSATVFDGGNFDLTTCTGTSTGRNTARWIITLSLSTAVTCNPHVFETRLGDDFTWAQNGGAGANTVPVTYFDVAGNGHPATTYAEGVTTDLQNISRTYCWVGQPAPRTEQFQIMGDARFCPYADTKDLDNYNWFWGIVNTANFPGFDKAIAYSGATAGWAGPSNKLEFDYPRVCQLYREGLLKTQSIWATLNGYSYWDFGMGGEIGAQPTAPTANGLHVNSQAWITQGVAAVNNAYVNEIGDSSDYATGATGVNMGLVSRRIVTSNDNTTWYARYWLGELCPDNYYANYWKNTAATIPGGGNLPCGSAVGNFYRALYTNNSVLDRQVSSLATSPGPVQFMNATTTNAAMSSSTTSTWFCPYTATAACTLTALGADLANLFNFPLGDFASADIRPYSVAANINTPNNWTEAVNASLRAQCDVPSVGTTQRVFYEINGGGYTPANSDTSGVVRVRDVLTAGVTNCFFTANNGLPAQGPAGTSLLGKIVLITMMRTFFDGGLYSNESHITQLPRVDLQKPGVGDVIYLNTSSMMVTWGSNFLKWDGTKYTSEYSAGYTEPVSVQYGLKYSSNSATGPWQWIQDGNATYAGDRPTGTHVLTGTSYSWTFASPVNFTPGRYWFLLEAYRSSYNLHYSYDMSEFVLR